MKIYLVRHGLTQWNKEGRYAGWSDVPLSPAGEEQAERLARHFAGLGPFALYSSDLNRAVATAQIIGRNHGVVPVVQPAFRELFFGEWEGKSYTELVLNSEPEFTRCFTEPFSCGPPGGETVTRLLERAWAGFTEVAAAGSPGDSAVVVSHGGTIRAVLHRCLGLGPDNFWDISVDNASVSLVSIVDRHFQVVFQNCREHLA